MTESDLLLQAGHRERLRQKLLDGNLTSYEKLELLLTFAIPRRDVRPLARRLINKYHSLYAIWSAPVEELMAFPGVGRSTAILLHLVRELLLLTHMERLVDGTVLSDPRVIKDYCRQLLYASPVEEFHVLYLGADYRLISDELHSRGTIDESGAYPREIARRAMALNALSVILVHNHPMSTNNFSDTDIELTSKIESDLKYFGIGLFDHLLVLSNGVVYSMREQPWLNKSSFNHSGL